MRSVINPQMLLDGADVGSIYLDPKSRDDIPQILRGLQHIYIDPTLRGCVFRPIVTARFGIVTAEFGNVTDRFGDVTADVLKAA